MRTRFVFVSSPADAANERKRVVRIIERLNVDFADVARIEPVRWEDRAYSAHEGFQEQIRKPTSCDIVVAILRGRIGAPLSPEFIEGLPPEEQVFEGGLVPTGTTYELLTAIAARRRGAKLPDIYAFRYAHAPSPALNAANRAEIEAQWRQLEAFVAQIFTTPEGYFKGALEPYASIDEFDGKVERALRQWVAENVLHGRAVVWPVATMGSPFRGLEPFGAKHAEVFFGRSGDRTRALERLKTLAEEGFPFLVVAGPSGAGKSSFVRAGLVPALVKPGVVEGVSAWRVAIARPSDGADALAALARRLYDGPGDIPPEDQGRPPALPELAKGDCARWEDLRGLFQLLAGAAFADDGDRDAVRRAATAPILGALARVAEAERQDTGAEAASPTRLIVVIDQLEEIFVADVAEEARAAFARVLEALASTGDVWIVATLRAESLEAFLKGPFAGLMRARRAPAGVGEADAGVAPTEEVERVFNLTAPSIADMGEVLRGPAAAAGIEWETDPATSQRLDDRILADLDRSDLLPHVQFVLQALFEERAMVGETPTLSWKAYEKIGSLNGAIDAAARRALEPLDDAGRAALPRLLRTLVAYPLGARGDGSPILRRVPFARAARDPAAEWLVKALTDARILISASEGKSGHVVALAHQRVIAAWDAARAIIEDNRTLLRIREDVDVACEAWATNGESADRLIPAGRRLADAEAAADALKDELSQEARDFVARSGGAARLRQRMVALSAVVFFLTAIAAAASATFFFDARNRAERNLGAAKQAIAGLDDFIWSANQGAQLMAGAKVDKVQASLGDLGRTLDELAARSPDDLDLLAIRAANYANFVDAYLVARSLKDASAAADEGVAVGDQMAKLDAGDPRSLKAEVMAAYKRADARKEALDIAGALADCREAVRLAAMLVAKSGSSADALRLQWVATEKLGEALAAARDKEAVPVLERATVLVRALSSVGLGRGLSAAADPARQRDLALSLASEGRAAIALGDGATSLARFADYLETARRLVAAHPADPLFQRDEGLALMSLGVAGGDQAGPDADLSAALDILRRLADADPLNARARHDVLAALAARARIRLHGDKPAASADLNEALKIARDFVALDSASARSRFDLTTVLMTLALNFDDAKPLGDEALSLIASLRAEGLLTPADQAKVAQFEQLVKSP